MKKNLLAISIAAITLLGAANVRADEEAFTWSCQDSKQFKTTGTTEKLRLTWESRTYDLDRQTSLPGSLRYKNPNSGFDLVVLGNKAMLFNIKAGVRLADFCQAIRVSRMNELVRLSQTGA